MKWRERSASTRPRLHGGGAELGARRDLAAVLTALAVPFLSSGCAEVTERYGPRSVEAPPPVGEISAPGALDTGPLRPSGPVALTSRPPARALVRPEIVTPTAPGQVPPPSALIGPEFGEPVSLNFVDAEIREVVDAVLGGILGRNYTIDPRVQGRVTTRTVRPIAYGEVRNVLMNILAVNGATIVDDGQVAAVVPLSVAQEMPRVVVSPGSGPQARGFGMYFIPVRNASAASIRETIAAQLGPGSKLALDESSNLLILTGTEQDARGVEEMVRVLDVDVLAGRSFAMLPLRAAQPQQVATEINAIIGDGTGGSGGRLVLPLERMNAVLAVAGSPSDLREVAGWVGRLDRADSGRAEDIFVYYVRAGVASELAETLSAVFGANGGGTLSQGIPGPIAPGLRAMEVGGPSYPPAAFPDVAGTEVLPGSADAPPSATMPGPADEDFALSMFGPEAPGRGYGSGISRFAGASAGLRIVADDVRNALIVRGDPADLRDVQAALLRLDVEPIQILIEATIAEVTLNDDLEYGIRWAFESGDFAGIFTDTLGGAVGPAFPGLNLILDTSDARAILSALAEVTHVEVVSSPQLMVLENQPARLLVGDQVPVATQSVVPIDDLDAPIVNSIAYVDTGVILEVTPRVNADGLVTIKVAQEVSDAVRTLSSDLNSPTIQQRLLNSTVAVRSGQTVVLGGLIRERQESGRLGIPLLMDIPVVGNIFRTTQRIGDRTELLVLITPRVVRDSYEAQMLTNELRERLTDLRHLVMLRE